MDVNDARFEADVRALADAYPNLLRHHLGQWALIVDARLVGVYDSRGSALERGYSFPPVGFIVHQVVEGDAQRLADWLAAWEVSMRPLHDWKYAGRSFHHLGSPALDWSGV